MVLHFRALCDHHQEVKIALYNIIQHYTASALITHVRGRLTDSSLNCVLSQPVLWTTTHRCDDTRCCIIQF